MATRYLTRAVLSTTKPLTGSLSHSYTSAVSFSGVVSRPSFIIRFRPLVAAASDAYYRLLAPTISTRGFATRPTASSLNDQHPNWSNRPPKETILLDGCDFEHWLVVVEPPPENSTRDEIIDSYIKTLATVIGSEDEARMKIYSVSTRCYYAFGALVSEELSYKIKELPNVRWVLPDSYLDVKNKDYGGEPFIDGQAVPYDPKYHEEWIRNNSRANERNRRNDRPRSFDRSRNFERRREMNNYQNTSGGNMAPPQNFSGPPPLNAPPPNAPPPNARPPLNAPPPFNAPNAGGPNVGHSNYGGGMPPPNNNPGNFQQRGPPPPPPPPPHNNNTPNYQYGPNGGPQGGYAPGMGPGQVQNQNNAYAPHNMGGGNHYQGQNAPPQPPNRGFSQGQNSGGFGPGPNQNSYGQNHNGYGPQEPNHCGYGNPPQSQNVPGRDYVN